jgi:hypothetical protein
VCHRCRHGVFYDILDIRDKKQLFGISDVWAEFIEEAVFQPGNIAGNPVLESPHHNENILHTPTCCE